jgi:FkbH-like protein
VLKLLLISDFNVTTLVQFVNTDMHDPACAASAAPFGQVVGPLLNDADFAGDFALVWTTPDKTSSAFGHALSFEAVSEQEVLSEVHEFAEYVKVVAGKFRAVFIVCWTLPCYQRGYGMMDLSSCGIRTLLMKMNLKLAAELQGTAGVFLLDAQKWIEKVGGKSYSPKLWYLAKSPFHPEIFKEAARDIKAAISGVIGQSKKLIVLDLDSTLWGGTLGDLGWENLRLGGPDYVGEAFVDFQKALKSLSRRGILLTIVSKNEEATALEAIRKHPEMILRLDDFVGWKINWSDKAVNIIELAAELKLGLQSIVFVDDNPLERARVREALPEVYVPDWPSDVTLFASHLLHMDCFDAPYTTAEDSSRSQLYTVERERQQFKKAVSSHAEWLRSLNTEVVVEAMSEANRARVIQLLNKTNQMNLRSRRATERELLDWLVGGNRKLWAFRVHDRFGDSGLAGLLALDIDRENAHISDFVLSCRMMGRNIEQFMVAVAAEYCCVLNLKQLVAEYVPSAKNRPCLDFWKSSGFQFTEGNSTFTWSLDKAYPYPIGIKATLPAEDFGDKSVSECCAPAERSQAVLSHDSCDLEL